MSLRDLPPVAENIPPRDKASQTLLTRQAVCPRSAYLHVRHDGGPASHEMHRGSAIHAIHQRIVETLIERGEHQMPWEVGKDLAAEVVASHPEWVIPPDEMDAIRLAAFHICECTVIDPESVLAVEKLFELELGGMRVRGKVDVAYAADGVLVVKDLKSQLWIPSQEEIDEKLQLPLYALLVGEGHPVREEVCEWCGGSGKPQTATEVVEMQVSDCYQCGGSGRIEIAEAPIGARFNSFQLDEVYPRREPWLEGTARVLPYRRRVIDRNELVDHRLYVEGLVAGFRHGVETGEWEAIRGSHCDTCAAKWECPLPKEAREEFGAIDSLAEAREAAERLVWLDEEKRRLQAAVRGYAKANDVSVPVGSDEEFAFEVVESEGWVIGKKIGRPDAAAAREAMLAGIQRAVETGEPFEIKDYRRVSRSSRFARRKVRAVEQESGAVGATNGPPPLPGRAPAESPEGRQARLDEAFGKDAPF